MIQLLTTFILALIIFTGVIEISRRIFLVNEKSEYFDVWDGTVGAFPQLDEDGWYVINTCGELAAVAKAVNAGTAPKGMNYKYRLAANLDLNNHTWTPIGGGAIGGTTTFTNTFDGAGHIIKNMKITNALYGGLFGVIENINDMGAVRISGITVHGTIGVSIMAGGIAALSAMYSIENCINYCTVVGSQQVGGIVGGIISAPLVSTGFTSIRNCINFGNIIIGGLTDRSVGAGGILGGMLQSDAGLQFQIYSCTNYGDIEIQPPLNNIAGVGGIVGGRVGLSTNCMTYYCSNGGSLKPSNLVTGFANPICFTGVTQSDCFYWNGPTSGVGTKVNSPSESIVTSMKLSNDLFLNTANEKIKVNVYPSDSYIKPNNPTVGIEVIHADSTRTVTQIPYDVESSFDASDLMVNNTGRVTYANEDPATGTHPIEANLYYRRYFNAPSLPDDTTDVWDGQITSDPFTGGPDADGYYIIDSASKFAAFTAKTNYQAYPGWTAFPETYVKVRVTKNINMNNHSTYCIGLLNYSNNKGFVGHFDGGGNRIANVNMICPSGDCGLFCFVNNDVQTGTDSIIENFQVTGKVTPNQLSHIYGGVIGIARNTKVQNISSNIKMEQDSNWSSLTIVGGLIGQNINVGNNRPIKNCLVLNSINTTVQYQPLTIGGIIGEFSNNIVENCTFDASTFSVADVDTAPLRMGGICGQATSGGVIRNCGAKVAQPTGAPNNVGGIVGYTDNPNIIMQCYYTTGNNNGKGGTRVTDTTQFPITTCILRTYAYPAENSWMKGVLYPRNVGVASNNISLEIKNTTGTTIRMAQLPKKSASVDKGYTLINLIGGAKGVATAPQPTSNPASTIIEFKIGGGVVVPNWNGDTAWGNGPWVDTSIFKTGTYNLRDADAKWYEVNTNNAVCSVLLDSGEVKIYPGSTGSPGSGGSSGSYSVELPLPQTLAGNGIMMAFSFVAELIPISGGATVYVQYNSPSKGLGTLESVTASNTFTSTAYEWESGASVIVFGSFQNQELYLTLKSIKFSHAQRPEPN